LKLVVDEPGSDEVSRIWSGARLMVSSRLLYPEARAALAAAVRAGRVGPREAPAVRLELEVVWRDVACVEVTPELAARAGGLAEEHDLRGYDAVHLSSVLEIDAPDTVLVTSASGLARAARALGVMTARVSVQSSAD